MYTEQIDLPALLRQILTNFLMSIASGNSVDAFISNSVEVRRLLTEFDELRDQNATMRETISSLEDQLNRATDIMTAQEERMNRNTNQEAVSLLLRAVEILGGTSEPSEVVYQTGEQIHETVQSAQEVEPITASDIDDFDDMYESDEVEDENLVSEDSVLEDEDLDSLYSDEFDLEDEDLEEEDVVQPTQEIVITKHPEITDNFVNPRDPHMNTLIFVRYSHLPYHYISEGIRYKLVLNGSEIVSSRV